MVTHISCNWECVCVAPQLLLNKFSDLRTFTNCYHLGNSKGWGNPCRTWGRVRAGPGTGQDSVTHQL